MFNGLILALLISAAACSFVLGSRFERVRHGGSDSLRAKVSVLRGQVEAGRWAVRYLDEDLALEKRRRLSLVSTPVEAFTESWPSDTASSIPRVKPQVIRLPR